MLKTYLYKELIDPNHLQASVALQKQTWGIEEISSVSQLVAAVHNGGCVIGAFDEERLIGFCYGFPGVSQITEKPYLVSHMMAVSPEYRNQKIGETLKFTQREWALKNGYEKIIWTFDPLEIRNGFLNVTKLGGYVKKYLQSYYGEMNDKINQGIPSDRFLLEWDLLSPSVIDASHGVRNSNSKWENYPLYLTYNIIEELPVSGNIEVLENEHGVLIPIPKQIQDIKRKSPKIAIDWRMNVRDAALQLLANGYVIKGVLRGTDMVGYYVLEQTEAE